MILTTAAPSRRPPWPDHCRLNDKGYALAYLDRSGGELITESPPDQGSVAPTEYGEQSRNPIFGGTLAIRDLTHGYGRNRLRGGHDGRYYYGLNFDPSAGPWLKGPALTSYTPATRDSTNGIDRFFEIGGQIFALNGRYVLDGNTDGTGWATSGQGTDFGVGNAATDVIVVQANDGSSSRYAWIGMGDSVAMYYFDGTTYTQTSGANLMYSRAFALDAVNLYRFDDTNRMWQCDLFNDPRTAANWPSATDRIGSKDHGVVRATVDQNGALVICKGDDIYSLNRDGTVNRLFQQQQFVTSTTNGEALGTWRNDIYVTYGNASYRLTSDGGLTQVGPELLDDNDSPVKGYITAWQGTDFCAYAAIYNPDTSASYLMKFMGEAVRDEQGDSTPVWHGSITAAFASKKITALHQSERGAASGHKMLYLGFSDGTIQKFTLPCSRNPAGCSSYTYSTADASAYLGRLYFYFASAPKLVISTTGEGEGFASTDYATLSYRTTESASFSALPESFNAGQALQVDLPSGTSGIFLDALLTLVSSSVTSSPKPTGLSFLWRLRDPPLKVMSANFVLADRQRRRDGTPYWRNAADIANELDALAEAATAVDFIDEDGTTRTVTVSTPRRVTGYEAVSRRPIAALQTVLVETGGPSPGIAFDAASSGHQNSGTSLTFAHTCTGANRVLVVLVRKGSATILSVTYNGVAMTPITDDGTNYGYYLVAPTTGANNVVVTMSSAATIWGVAASYTGARQSGQPDASATFSDAANPSTATLTVAETGAWLLALAVSTSAISAGSGATLRAQTGILVLRDAAILDSNAALVAGSRSISMGAATGTQGVVVSIRKA